MHKALVAAACITIILIGLYLLASEVISHQASRKMAMTIKCREVQSEVLSPISQEEMSKLAADQIRTKMRKIEDCQKFWISGKITLE